MDGPSRRPTDSSRSEGTPSLSEVPSGGARALWLLWGFSKVTRCKSGTISRRYQKNGYALNRRHYRKNGYALSRNHRKNGNQPHPQNCNHHPPPTNPTLNPTHNQPPQRRSPPTPPSCPHPHHQHHPTAAITHTARADCTQATPNPSYRNNFTVVADNPRNNPAPPKGVSVSTRGRNSARSPATRAASRSSSQQPPPNTHELPPRYSTMHTPSNQLKLSLSCG